MSKPVTISVHVGTGSEGEQRLIEWKTAAAKAGLWHGDTPAVGKWLSQLADREIEFLEEIEADLAREEENRRLYNMLYESSR